MEIGFIAGVIGLIDGRHVQIAKPSTADHEEFRCRKVYFSINVQGVCSPGLEFTNIVARWKCAMHDARIYRSSW